MEKPRQRFTLQPPTDLPAVDGQASIQLWAGHGVSNPTLHRSRTPPQAIRGLSGSDTASTASGGLPLANLEAGIDDLAANRAIRLLQYLFRGQTADEKSI